MLLTYEEVVNMIDAALAAGGRVGVFVNHCYNQEIQKKLLSAQVVTRREP